MGILEGQVGTHTVDGGRLKFDLPTRLLRRDVEEALGEMD